MGPDLPICPDCSGRLKLGLAIARFIDRPDIRVLLCEGCHHVHWFALEHPRGIRQISGLAPPVGVAERPRYRPRDQGLPRPFRGQRGAYP